MPVTNTITASAAAHHDFPEGWQGLADYAQPLAEVCTVFGVSPAALASSRTVPEPVLLRQAMMWLLATATEQSQAEIAKRMPRYSDEDGGAFSHTTVLYAAQKIYHALQAHGVAVGEAGKTYAAALQRKNPKLDLVLSPAQAEALWDIRTRLIAARAAAPVAPPELQTAAARAAYLQSHHSELLALVREQFPYVTDTEEHLVRRAPRKRYMKARKALIYLLRKQAKLPYERIGALFDSRKRGEVLRHAGVIEVVRSFEMALASGQSLKSQPPLAVMRKLEAFVGAAEVVAPKKTPTVLAMTLERDYAPELQCLRQIIPECPSSTELVRHSQIYKTSRARAVLIYLIRKNTGKSFAEIAQLFQGALRRPYMQDVTVRRACAKVEGAVYGAGPAIKLRPTTLRQLQAHAVAQALYGCLLPK